MAKETNTPTGTMDTNSTVNSEAPAVEAASSSTSTPTDSTNMSDITGMRYTGRASVRTITAEDFKGVGVDAPNDLEWNASNGFVVPVSSFNAAVRDYLLKDGEFAVVK